MTDLTVEDKKMISDVLDGLQVQDSQFENNLNELLDKVDPEAKTRRTSNGLSPKKVISEIADEFNKLSPPTLASARGQIPIKGLPRSRYHFEFNYLVRKSLVSIAYHIEYCEFDITNIENFAEFLGPDYVVNATWLKGKGVAVTKYLSLNQVSYKDIALELKTLIDKFHEFYP